MTSHEQRVAATRGLLAGSRSMMRHFVHRRVTNGAAFERPLFLAPHPDDIEIGCGGTLIQSVDAGRSPTMVQLTDGCAVGTPDQDEHFRAVRLAEARSVTARLGIEGPLALGFDERTFRDPARREERAQRLRAILDEREPDAVFVPYLADQHPDHRYTNVLLAEALRGSRHAPQVIGFEVWSFVPPGLVVDISACMERKAELMALHASQLAFIDYVHLVHTLGALHAPLIPGATACEAFCAMRTDAFIDAVDELALVDPGACGDEVLLTPPPSMP